MNEDTNYSYKYGVLECKFEKYLLTCCYTDTGNISSTTVYDDNFIAGKKISSEHYIITKKCLVKIG